MTDRADARAAAIARFEPENPLTAFLRKGPYEPLVVREEVLATACACCGAAPGEPCTDAGMRPRLAGFALRGMSGIHMRRYQDLAHDPR